MNLKPASVKARASLKKLQALAERGIDGERLAAQRKIVRLKAHFDFTGPDPAETPDLFAGSFQPSSKARRIYSFSANEFDVANAVKWAIESATKITCSYRRGGLWAEASACTANKLTEIALHIANSFHTLVDQFGAVDGVNRNDRAVFVMGLYDGMMNDARNAGQRLPGRTGTTKTRKSKKKPVTGAEKPVAGDAGLNIHPYSVALSLGKQIRFSAPLEQITAELEAATRKQISHVDDSGE